MPLTVVVTFLMAGIVTVLSTRRWANFGFALLACVVLVLSLGLNVSIIGLVSLPSGSLYLVVELFALILALGVVFAVAFAILERKHSVRDSPNEQKRRAHPFCEKSRIKYLAFHGGVRFRDSINPKARFDQHIQRGRQRSVILHHAIDYPA